MRSGTTLCKAEKEVSKIFAGRPNADSRRRAVSSPTPAVSASRNQAASSSGAWCCVNRGPSLASTPLFRRFGEVANIDGILHFHDQTIRNMVEHAEDKQGAVLFVRQLDQL